MADSSMSLRKLLSDPRESLDLELKQWFDPSTKQGRAKVAKACLALRNNNGGRLIIGFKDDGLPDNLNQPQDVRSTFRIDIIQGIVGQFAAEPFGVEVDFVEINGQTYPVITVPSGVRTPIAAKASLRDEQGKELIRDHAVYVRSLTSNNTVSTSEVRRADWDHLMRICFENREADIGGFVRRHLAALNPAILAALGPTITGLLNPPTTAERAATELDIGKGRFEAAAKRLETQLPELGFYESLVLIDGSFTKQAESEAFISGLLRKAPQHTGWPPFVYLPNAPEKAYHPYVFEHGWEALINDLEVEAPPFAGFDFWRIEPRGFFYRLRVFEDDLARSHVNPRTCLDYVLQVSRMAEVISTGLSFGHSLGCDPSNTSLIIGSRWTGLAGRRLACWSEPMRWSYVGGTAVQNAAMTSIVVPLETPQAGIAPHAENALRDLFLLFAGSTIESRVVEMIVGQALQLIR